MFGATSRAMAFEPLLGNEAAQYDPTKFNWIGSANDEVSVCMAWHTSGVRHSRMCRQASLSSAPAAPPTTPISSRDRQQHVRRQVQDGIGYPGGNEINIAVERGEVQGRCGFHGRPSRHPHGTGSREEFNLLMQFSLAKHADLPDVPLVMDLARTTNSGRS